MVPRISFDLNNMKAVKGRFLNKLNFIPTIKQGLDLHFTSSLKLSDPEFPKHFKDEEEFQLESSGIMSVQEKINDVEVQEHPVISLTEFIEKCPPGGENTIIFYTTSLRGIRKTFEDCSAIRFLLESFRVKFQERDVSLHLQYRDELWRLLSGRVIPPKLFIKGRYIGGADEIIGLHEQGKLKKLLEGMPRSLGSYSACEGCGNVRFVVCFDCNGSCKVVKDRDEDEDDGEVVYIRCPECNENGLVKCPLCS